MFSIVDFDPKKSLYAFLPNTIKRLEDEWWNGRTAGYQLQAYFLAKKKPNSGVRLAFGEVLMEFPSTGYKNLSYEEILQEARADTGFRLLDNSQFDVATFSDVILEKHSIWTASVEVSRSRNLDNRHETTRNLITAFGDLPAVPAGADGWYSLGRNK